MKPSNEMLNRAMAEACGWIEVFPGVSPGVLAGTPPELAKTRNMRRVPDFCTDRRTLPEIIRAVRAAGKVHEFLDEVVDLEDGCGFAAKGHGMTVLAAEPRQHVIAALKVLGKWSADWTVEP